MRPVHLYLLSVLVFGGVLFSINDVSATANPHPQLSSRSRYLANDMQYPRYWGVEYCDSYGW